MLTYKQQWEIAKEVKNSPQIKKRNAFQTVLLVTGLLVMMAGALTLFYAMVQAFIYDYDMNFILMGAGLGGLVLSILLTKGMTAVMQKTEKIIDSTLYSRFTSAAESAQPLSDQEKLAYYEEKNKTVEKETAVMKKYFWWSIASKCSVAAILAFAALLFMKGIAFLGLLKFDLFEFFKDAGKGLGKKDKDTILISFFAMEGGELKDVTVKSVLRFGSFLMFVFYAFIAVVYFITTLGYLFKSKEVEKKVRLQDKAVINAKMANWIRPNAFEMDKIIVRMSLSFLLKAVCLFAFPIMFFDYIKDGLFVTSAYMYIIPAILLLIDISVQTARLVYASQNKEIMEKMLPLFDKDALLYSF